MYAHAILPYGAMHRAKQFKSGTVIYDSMQPDEPPAELSPGSQLCTQCGLCCTGALHNFAVLEADELDFALSLGLALRSEGRPGFALPCPYLEGCSCSIYTSRPKVCGRYVCQLLDNVQQQKTSVEQGLERVLIAKELFSEVQGLLPPNMTFPEARLLITQPIDPGQSDQQRSRALQLRLALTKLCVYLDKHFKHWRESKLLMMKSVDQIELKDL
jgi:Fe-S-cluster containining protein